MTDSGGLQQSLAAMGFVELGLALVALCCYSLAFNGSLAGPTRLKAAACAMLAAGGFVATTDPWVHGVILMVIGIAGIGLFVAAVWVLSAVCGLTRRKEPLPASALLPDGSVLENPAAAVRVGPPTPIHSA